MSTTFSFVYRSIAFGCVQIVIIYKTKDACIRCCNSKITSSPKLQLHIVSKLHIVMYKLTGVHVRR